MWVVRLRRGSAKTIVMILGIAAWVSACANQGYQVQPGEKMTVTQHVMDFYKQKYLPQVGAVNQAAFAVSQDGTDAGYSYCPDIRCKSGNTVGQDAIHECQSSGSKCYVFAIGSAIKVDYIVVP